MLKKFNSNKISGLQRMYNANRHRSATSNLKYRRRDLSIKQALNPTPADRLQVQIRTVFTPEATTRVFSPQPWRVFSPINRTIIQKPK